MRNIVVISLYLMASNTIFGQNIDDVRFRVIDKNVEVFYSASNIYQLYTNIKLSYSLDYGNTYYECLSVEGDVGEITPEKSNKITWFVTKDMDQLEGDIKFKVVATRYNYPAKKIINVGWAGSPFHPAIGFSLTMGFVSAKRFGGYAKYVQHKTKTDEKEAVNAMGLGIFYEVLREPISLSLALGASSISYERFPSDEPNYAGTELKPDFGFLAGWKNKNVLVGTNSKSIWIGLGMSF
jgi:hypothetical protein